MTTAVSLDIFREIDDEHRDLDHQYEAIRDFLGDVPGRPEVIRQRFAQLAALLECHFAREEEDGYFDEIIELAPRLASQVAMLQAEHDDLLCRLQRFDERIAATIDLAADYEMFRRDFGEFLDACVEHEARETTLVQEAYLVDIGVGD